MILIIAVHSFSARWQEHLICLEPSSLALWRVKVKPLYNVVVANLTGLRENENRKRRWNRLLWNQNTLQQNRRLETNRIGGWLQLRRFECIRLVLKHFTRNMVFIPFKLGGLGLTLQHNMTLSVAPAALVAWFPAPWRSTLPTLLGAALHNRLQPKSCLLHRKTIQMAGYGLGNMYELIPNGWGKTWFTANEIYMWV